MANDKSLYDPNEEVDKKTSCEVEAHDFSRHTDGFTVIEKPKMVDGKYYCS